MRVKSCDPSPHELCLLPFSLSFQRKEHSVWGEDSGGLKGLCQAEAYSLRVWITDKACVPKEQQVTKIQYTDHLYVYTCNAFLSSFVLLSNFFFSCRLTSAMFPCGHQVSIHLLIELTAHMFF